MHAGDYVDHNPGKTWLRKQRIIDRCFYHNTVEEIMEALKKERDPWAHRVHQQMSKNSMLSMKITLKMMRYAKNECYGNILRKEANAVLHKVRDEDFLNGVRDVYLGHRGKEGRKNPRFIKDPSNELVDSYFKDHKDLPKMGINIVQGALYPTREYYEQYPDCVRFWLNEESHPSPDVMYTYEQDLPKALQEIGIDLRDKMLDIEHARSKIASGHKVERIGKIMEERMQAFAQDKQLQEEYFGKIFNEFEQFKDDKFYYNYVNTAI
jgi:hypothetical protein